MANNFAIVFVSVFHEPKFEAASRVQSPQFQLMKTSYRSSFYRFVAFYCDRPVLNVPVSFAQNVHGKHVVNLRASPFQVV